MKVLSRFLAVPSNRPTTSIRPRRVGSKSLALAIGIGCAITQFVTQSAHAQAFYYWDENAADAGFGTAGTNAVNWSSSSSLFTTDALGTTAPTGTQATTTADTAYFGDVGKGLGAGTVNVSGTVQVNTVSFGNANGAVALQGGTINFNGAYNLLVNNRNSAANPVTVYSNITSTSAATVLRLRAVGANSSLVIAGNIGGTNPGNLFIEGTGAVTLSGQNTFTGNVQIGSNDGTVGTLIVSNMGNQGSTTSNLGAGSTINMGAGGNVGTLRYIGTGETSNRNFVGNSSSAGTDGVIDQSGASGLLKLTGNYTMQGIGTGRKVTFQGSTAATGEFGGVISDGSAAAVFSVVKAGTSTWTLSGANTYRGTTTVNDGTLQFAKRSALYNNTSANWTAANIIVNNGGTLAFNVGGTNEFTTGTVTTLLTNLDGAVNNNGLRAGSSIAFDTTNATGSFTIANAIKNTTGTGGGAVGLTKLGANTLILSGDSLYTGATKVNAGKLLVSGSLTGSVTSVNSGGTLGGSGSVAAITLNAGGAIEAGSIGDDLKATSLTWNGETTGAFAQMKFELSAIDATSDLLALSGALTKGTTGTVFSFEFTGGVDNTTYTLLTFDTATGFSVNDFSYTGLPSGGYFELQDHALLFTTVPEPGSMSVLLAGVTGLLGLQRLRRRPA